MDLALQSAFLAETSILLVLLAGTVLLYRSFREKYLVAWIAGWTVYGGYKFFVAFGATHAAPRLWMALANAFFALAVGLFAASVFLYVHQKRLAVLASGVILFALLAGVASASVFPDSQAAAWVFHGAWFLVLAVAVFWLVRFALGRHNIGHWILACSLLLLHLDRRQTAHAIAGYDILVDLLLGVGIMLVVLDDSRVQVARLDVLNTVTNEISGSTDFDVMAGIVLTQLVRLTRARAAWFRLLQGDKLVLTVQQGMSEALAETREVDSGTPASWALRNGEVVVLNVPQMIPAMRPAVVAQGIRHLVVIPVKTKNSDFGVLVLGMPGYRAYTQGDKNFLKGVAQQLGFAAENRGLVQQLVRSRNEWASTFNSIPDYILVHDKEYRILRVNRALLDRLNLTRTQVIQQTCQAVLPGAGSSWQSCPYCDNATTSPASEDDPCFGGYSLVTTSAYTGEEVSGGGTVHVIKDITEARAAEERYKALFSHMQEGVFVATPEGKVIDCNDAFVRMLGYANKEEILKLETAESLYLNAAHREKFSSEMARQGFVRNFEYPLRCKDGREISVIESSFATRGPGGGIERYQGVLLDVTEMKRAEDEIRRRNRELYVLNNIAVTFNQSFDLDEILQITMLQIVELFSTDTSAVYLFQEETNTMQKKSSYGHRSAWVTENDNFALPQDFVDMIKTTRAEIISHEDMLRLPEIIHKYVSLEDLQAWLWVILWRKEKILGLLGTSTRVPRDFSPSEESVMIAVGRQLATTIEKIHLYSETRRAYEDLRRTQEQLLQSEKMSAVGQLISGVAHELNNPLTAIMGYAQLLEGEQLEPRIQEFIHKLQKQAQRTQKIVQNLLSFAREHKPQKLHLDLRNAVEDAIALREYDMRVNNITVERNVDADLPPVMGDAHQLEQVCLNILNNAADAMMEGGAGGRLRLRMFVEGGEVVAEFHDSGPGFAEPSRVFDPFYTTKGVGKGTGLGLSICYGIVKEHGGEIRVRNHPGGGAVVEIRLPVAVGKKPLTERERIVARRESRLEGRVLLLDDEEDVLAFEREVLTAAGLSVVAAASGAEAMEKLKNETFDVVLLDSKVPGEVSSTDVYHWMQEARPELASKTVFVLSNLSDPETRAFVDLTRIRCLVKPFGVSDLLAVARRMLRKSVTASRTS
ncbi:MAG TPA: GAF domain-containing protein [Verrucomicrobiae bacterium]|nr:GAF domain-containing protein [Verrucomicrobiae bacterium]